MDFKGYKQFCGLGTLTHRGQLIEDIGGDLCCTVFALVITPFFIQSTSVFTLPIFVGTATGPTALCGIRTTPRIEILSPEIQPSNPLVGMSGDRTRVSRVESEYHTRSATKGAFSCSLSLSLSLSLSPFPFC